jgi:cobalt/nickel transport system permease protein
MHHVIVEGWSRRGGPLHDRDARAKLVVLLVFLVSVSTTPPGASIPLSGFALLLAVAAASSRLPVVQLLARAALVLPFSATFALITWWAGDRTLALTLASKSFLSALAALLLIATTPIAEFSAALEYFRVPRTLVLVIQFLYRYLFVISEQAQHMRLAALARQGSRKSRRPRFHAAAGALGVLFAKSWERADGVYEAMLARGFRGHLPLAVPLHFHFADYLLLTIASAACLAVRAVL